MIPSHITIVGPTAINQAELNEISVHLDNVCDQIAPFTVELDGTGTFRPVNPVVFLNITTGYDELLALQKAVCTGPLECPLRFAYHPHVTLAHGVPEPQLDLAMGEFAGLKARFPAEALWLYRHEADGVWRKYCKFELRGK
jgi:2'-5' RNA ligase